MAVSAEKPPCLTYVQPRLDAGTCTTQWYCYTADSHKQIGISDAGTSSGPSLQDCYHNHASAGQTSHFVMMGMDSSHSGACGPHVLEVLKLQTVAYTSSRESPGGGFLPSVIWDNTNLHESAMVNEMLKSLECIWIPCNKCLPMDALHPCSMACPTY